VLGVFGVFFLFEVEDLKVASPAIISKCGIVHNNHDDYGWRLYVNSWLNSCKFKLFKDEVINLLIYTYWW
jgi:dynein heavy chain